MSKIFKKIAAVAIAGIATMSLSMAASAECSHYSQRLSCGAYVGEVHQNHVYYTTVNGVQVAKNCTQKITNRRHTITCTVNGGCGYSKTDNGSACYMSHTSCGIAGKSLH